MSLQCPGCKADLDLDSCYCDQCGAELMKCGMCGYTGKGKMCPHDRTPLLPAKALAATRGSTANQVASAPPATAPDDKAGANALTAASTAVAPAPAPTAPATPAAPAAAPAVTAPAPAPASAPAPAAPRTLCLRNPAQGVLLRPAPGAILGRRFGAHADVLARFSQISSNHLELQRDARGQWTAQDMNSFNGSFYNGRKLVPGQAQVLDAGGQLVLGDITFVVSFE